MAPFFIPTYQILHKSSYKKDITFFCILLLLGKLPLKKIEGESKQEQAGEESCRNHSTFANFSEETGPLTLFLLFFYNPLSPDIQIWLVRLLLLPASEPSHPPTTFDTRIQHWVHLIRTSLCVSLQTNTHMTLRICFPFEFCVFFGLWVVILRVLSFSRYSLDATPTAATRHLLLQVFTQTMMMRTDLKLQQLLLASSSIYYLPTQNG
jgi:hypothetical protein